MSEDTECLELKTTEYIIRASKREQTLHLSGLIQNQIAIDLDKAFEFLLQKDPGCTQITFKIDSCGGLVHCGLACMDTIQEWLSARSFHLDTVAIGQCSSTAVLLFMQGHERYAMKHAFFILHELQSASAAAFITYNAHLKQCLNIYLAEIHRSTGISKATIVQFMKSTKVLYAEEAHTLQFIHGIWPVNHNNTVEYEVLEEAISKQYFEPTPVSLKTKFNDFIHDTTVQYTSVIIVGICCISTIVTKYIKYK